MFCSKGSLTLLAVLFVCSVRAREFQFLNNLPGEVWIGSLGNANKPPLNNGGWKLGVGQRMSVHSADDWAGRFWARTWCNAGNNHCETGDCGNRLQCNGAGGEPPVTLAEITLKGHEGLDFYDISLVDGFNVKMSMAPLGGQGDGSKYSCARVGCDHELTHDCPQELRQVGSSGHVIACKSACRAFGTDQYCCAGAHNRPETCRASDWPVNYPKFFKDRCPDAYSYAYDDHKSTFTCRAPAYLITIG